MESSIDVWHWVGLVAGSAKADDYDCRGWETLNLRTFEETFIIMRINFYFNISPNEFLLFSENHLKNKNKFWYIFPSPFANDKVLCFNIFFICYFFPSSSSSSFLTWLHTHTKYISLFRFFFSAVCALAPSAKLKANENGNVRK